MEFQLPKEKYYLDEMQDGLEVYIDEIQDGLNKGYSEIDSADFFPKQDQLAKAKTELSSRLYALNDGEKELEINVARNGDQLSISCKDFDVELHYTLSHSTTISGENSTLNRMSDVLSEVDEALYNYEDVHKAKFVSYNGNPNLDLRSGGFVDLGSAPTDKDFLPALLTNNEFCLSSDAVKGMTNSLSAAHNSRILQYLNTKWAARGKNV